MMSSAIEVVTRQLVLAVEVDEDDRRAVEEALAADFALVTAPAAEAGVGALRPDLLVYGGGGPGGLSRLRLREGLLEVPALLITAAGDREQGAAPIGPAAHDYVEAPLCPAVVRARALNLLALKRARDALRSLAGSDAADLDQLARDAARRREALEAALAAALRARERAERLSRTKTAFLRTVGHELRAPLSTLREALPRLGVDSPPVRAIEAAVDWVGELRNALLERARADGEEA